MSKSRDSETVTVTVGELRIVRVALEDARTEIEAMERTANWYTASQKLIDRLDRAAAVVIKALK